MFPQKLFAGASLAATGLISFVVASAASAQAAAPIAPTTAPATSAPATGIPAAGAPAAGAPAAGAPAAGAPAAGAPAAAMQAASAAVPAGTVLLVANDASREQDDIFLQLRDAARQGDANRAAGLASRLPNYAIPSYVDYYRLKPRLRDASDAEVLDFLKRYEGSAIADRMRNDWLLELGRKRDWVNFDRELPLFVKKDDYQVKCYALLSRAIKGERVAAEARALLDNPPQYGDACAALVGQLAQSGQFTQADLLAQQQCGTARRTRGRRRRSTCRRWRWRAASATRAPSMKSTWSRSAAWRAPA
jgi:soluble lytic murein transglycosylase